MAKVDEPSLISAVGRGDGAAVRAILAGGADVDTLGAAKQTALMWAARRNDVALVKLLVGAGADLDRADANGWTALAYAAVEDARNAVDALLAAGASPDVSSGRALMGAISRGGPAVVEKLVAAGADLSLLGWHERMPLEHAAKRGDTELVAALLRGKNPQLALDRALVEAAAEGHIAAVELLVAAGADPTFTTERGNSALGLARKRRRKEVVALLVLRGATVSKTASKKRALPPPPELRTPALDASQNALVAALSASTSAKRLAAAKKATKLADRALEGPLVAALARELADVRTWEPQRELARALGACARAAETAAWIERVLAAARFEPTVVPAALAEAAVRIHARGAGASAGVASADRLLLLALSDTPTQGERLAIVGGTLVAAKAVGLRASPALAERVEAYVRSPGVVHPSLGAMLNSARTAWAAYTAVREPATMGTWCAVKKGGRSREAASLALRAALLQRVRVPSR